MLVYRHAGNNMDCWTRLEYLLVASGILCDLLRVSSEENGRDRSNRRNNNDKRVIFPVSNETGPSLPVFPDPIPDPIVEYVGRDRPLMPPVDKFGHPLCAQNENDTFCEDVDNYPSSAIRRVMTFSPEEFKDYFVPKAIHRRKMLPSDVNEETVCPQKTRLFYPKAAVNENDQWAFVINDVDYIQAVMAEMCENEDKPCTYLDGALPVGVSSRCRQKFAYKKLLALHPNQKKTYTDSFRFPSCCVCFVTRTYVLTRSRHISLKDEKPVH